MGIVKKKSESRSIKKQINVLLVVTIALLVILSCTAGMIAFLNFVKEKEFHYLDGALNSLYENLIVETDEELRGANEYITQSFSKAFTVEDMLIQLSRDRDYLSTGDFWIMTSKGENFFTSSSVEVSSSTLEAFIGSEKEFILTQTETGDLCMLFKSSYQIGQDSYFVITSKILDNQRIIRKINDNFNVLTTIFYNKKRIATSFTNKNGESAEGSFINDEINKRLIEKSSIYRGKVNIENESYLTIYQRIENHGDEDSIIIAVGEPWSPLLYTIYRGWIIVLVFGIGVFVIVTMLASKILEKRILKPIEDMGIILSDYSQGKEKLEKILYYDEFKEFKELNKIIYSMIRELKISKERIEKVAYVDELTKMPNRYYLFETYGQEFQEQSIYCLLCMDVDDLKKINDTYGHRVGDLLIIGLSRFLIGCLKKYPEYELFRVGGDEFVIVSTSKQSKDQVRILANEIMERLKAPFYADEYMMEISFSIGIVMDAKGKESLEQLMKAAEIAMYEVKTSSKNNYMFYHQEMSERLMYKEKIERNLKQALKKGEFHLVYQPKMNLKTGKCDGVEALMRWKSPVLGNIPPSEFIPIAEENGMIHPMGFWVLSQACKTVADIKKKLGIDIHMAVNISVVQLWKEEFVNEVLECIELYKLNPSDIELEITESVLMNFLETTVDKLRELYMLGNGISVDDFGKGYSSLAYLKNLPITSVKIDKLFIDDIGITVDTLIKNIIDIGHQMGLMVVAEGVENERQLEYLRHEGCDIIQGYYYSKPLVMEDLITFLENEKNLQEARKKQEE